MSASLQACKALRSSAEHGIEVLTHQVTHKLQQHQPPNSHHHELPLTDAHANEMDALFKEFWGVPAVPEDPPEAAAAAAAAAEASADPQNAQAPAQPPDRRSSWQYWDAALSAILAGNLQQTSQLQDLKADARLLGVYQPHLPQEELEAAVLAAFGLSRANNRQLPAPAVLLMAVRHEHYHEGITADGADGCGGLHVALRRLSQLARELRVPLGLAAQAWGYGEGHVGF
jgi:hypothetical protein